MKQNKSYLSKIKPVAIGSAMADLALLLLIFFMATTTAEPPKIAEVVLPSAETQASESDTIYITIVKNGTIYYDGESVSYEKLKESLALRQAEKNKVISISADKDLDYQNVGALLTLLQELDFLNVVFMSQPQD